MACLEKVKAAEHFAKCCAEAGSPLDEHGLQEVQTKILSILAEAGEIDMLEATSIISYIGRSTLPSTLRQDILTSVKHRVNLSESQGVPDSKQNPDELKNKNHYELQHLLPQSIWSLMGSPSVNPLSLCYLIVKHALNCDLKYVRRLLAWPIVNSCSDIRKI